MQRPTSKTSCSKSSCRARRITDGLARHEQSGTVGKRAGIVQAYADLSISALRLRAGSFWLPTSRENVDPLWTSRYTITYSALNSWIGQEVRPLGADLQFSPNFYFTMGATAFRGNDTMGTLLASRATCARRRAIPQPTSSGDAGIGSQSRGRPRIGLQGGGLPALGLLWL